MPTNGESLPRGHGKDYLQMVLQALATLFLGLVVYTFISAIGRLEKIADRDSQRINEIERNLVRLSEIVISVGEQARRDREQIQRNSEVNDRQWQEMRKGIR